MATKATPKKYATLKKQVAKKGVSGGVEKTALTRVMRHQDMSRKDAKAYLKTRTDKGMSVGGFMSKERAAARKAK